MKTCAACGAEKPLSEFYAGKSPCKPCHSVRTAAWRSANPERVRASDRRYKETNREKKLESDRRVNLRARFGITPEGYETMLIEQGGACAVCRDGCATGRRLSVDHCHETGRVRGLLCLRCNTALGSFRDRPELLLRAATYLEGSRVN